MKKLILIAGIVCCMMHTVSAQQVQRMSVDEFFAQTEQSSDTLYVYNFWATWCKPCVAELPYFLEVNEKYKAKKVKVVLVSLDFPEQYETRLLKFVEERKLTADVIFLTDALRNQGWIERVHEKWSGAIPATLIAMPSHDILEFREQSFEYEELADWLDAVLGKIEHN